MTDEARSTAGESRRLERRGVAALAGLFGVVTVAGGSYGVAATAGVLPGGARALVAGPTLLYGLVLLGAAWSGRSGHGLFVLTTLLGLGVALVVSGPLGVSVLDPVRWGVLVGTLSVVVGVPSILLVHLDARTATPAAAGASL